MAFAASRLAQVKPSASAWVSQAAKDARARGGAFYGLIGCESLIGATTPDGDAIMDDTDVTAYLLKAAGVAAVPGSAYDLSPFFRISTAASEEVLSTAMDRIAAAVADLEGIDL